MKLDLLSPYFREIKNIPNINEEKFIGYLNICLHEDIIYLNYNGLFTLTTEGLISNENVQLNWQEITPIPFGQRYGQTMTSTPYGLAFFGGRDNENCYFNDLWLYYNKEWTYITCNIEKRACHSTIWDGKSNLIIYGGISNLLLTNDFYFINILNQTTKKISINFPFLLNTFTLTLNSLGEIILYGGKDINNNYS